ncbi:AAA-domain-containing protein, partial [Thozetella sp. PMI_491]
MRWEQQFLNNLISSEDVEEGWLDIVIEEEVKDLLIKLVHQRSETKASSYGVLKRGRVGGALLYGPPGVGKTHLARVLARETNTVMIGVSSADMLASWVGDTEKAIKGLFNLGRILAPSIIYIDEADALVRKRSEMERGYERSQKNQLLLEMDGLKRSKTPPFVLLSTNYPRQLDQAIHRRAPSLIHMGLPSNQERLQIFQICLRDEILDADVDVGSLAVRSKGYSGSDIMTVCVQAAL